MLQQKEMAWIITRYLRRQTGRRIPGRISVPVHFSPVPIRICRTCTAEHLPVWTRHIPHRIFLCSQRRKYSSIHLLQEPVQEPVQVAAFRIPHRISQCLRLSRKRNPIRRLQEQERGLVPVQLQVQPAAAAVADTVAVAAAADTAVVVVAAGTAAVEAVADTAVAADIAVAGAAVADPSGRDFVHSCHRHFEPCSFP